VDGQGGAITPEHEIRNELKKLNATMAEIAEALKKIAGRNETEGVDQAQRVMGGTR
jgi:hypothetical protein